VKDIHIIIPEPVNVSLLGKRVFAYVIKLMILKQDYPRLASRP
jgi:hypothetical protein